MSDQPAAIIFDFNGVIINDEPIHFDLFRQLASEAGIEVSEEMYWNRYCALDDRDGLRAIWADASRELDDAKLTELIEEKSARYDERIAQDAELFPGALEAIASLAASWTLAIGSGALHHEIDLILDRFNLRDAFPVVVAADDVAQSKPDPETYVAAADALRSMNIDLDDRSEMVVIEDTPAGIASARAAGMRVIAVTHTYASDRLAEADWVVETIGELNAESIRTLWRTTS